MRYLNLSLIALAALVLAAWNSTFTASPVPATKTTFSEPAENPDSASGTVGAGVPILYADEVDQHSRLVTKAVDSNGLNLGIVADTYGATWAPDGKTFGIVLSDGPELVVQSLGQKGKTLLRAGAEERFRKIVAWSPDGKRIALITRTPEFSDGKEIVVVEGGHEVARYPLPPLAAEHLWSPNKFRWSPDGKKILLSWDYTIVVHTDTNTIETISDKRVMAEWSPESDAVYYFDIIPTKQTFSEFAYGDLGSFNLKKLGKLEPTILMTQEQVFALGLHTNISAFELKAEDLQYNRGLMDLSPGGSKMVIVSGLASGSRFSFYTMTPGKPLTLEKPEKIVIVDSSTGSVEWSPDETQIAVISVGGKDGPAVKVLDLKTEKWKLLATLGYEIPTYRFAEQINLLLKLSSKTLSWTQ